MKNNNKIIINLDQLDIFLLKEFKEFVKDEIDDPRQIGKVEYKIWDIIVTATIAILCNNDDTTDMHDFIVSKKNIF